MKKVLTMCSLLMISLKLSAQGNFYDNKNAVEIHGGYVSTEYPDNYDGAVGISYYNKRNIVVDFTLIKNGFLVGFGGYIKRKEGLGKILYPSFSIAGGLVRTPYGRNLVIGASGELNVRIINKEKIKVECYAGASVAVANYVSDDIHSNTSASGASVVTMPIGATFGLIPTDHLVLNYGIGSNIGKERTTTSVHVALGVMF